MSEYKFNNIVFDTDTKTFIITKGSVGSYSYTDIVKCSILFEDSRYTGKTNMFDHQAIGGVGVYTWANATMIHTGLRLKMKDGNILYVYISDTPKMANTMSFFKDEREAKRAKEFITKIIKKYA